MSNETRRGTPPIATKQGELEIVTAQSFEAPLELVWRLWTSAEHLPEFWGGGDAATTVDTWQFEPGGKWRIVSAQGDDVEHAFRGEFQDIDLHERIVWTFEYEGAPGHISVETITFSEADGLTTLHTLSQYTVVQARDGHYDSGMEGGMRRMHAAFVELLDRELAA